MRFGEGGRSGPRLGRVQAEFGKATLKQEERSRKRSAGRSKIQPRPSMAGNRPNAGRVESVACSRLARIRGLRVPCATRRRARPLRAYRALHRRTERRADGGLRNVGAYVTMTSAACSVHSPGAIRVNTAPSTFRNRGSHGADWRLKSSRKDQAFRWGYARLCAVRAGRSCEPRHWGTIHFRLLYTSHNRARRGHRQGQVSKLSRNRSD